MKQGITKSDIRSMVREELNYINESRRPKQDVIRQLYDKLDYASRKGDYVRIIDEMLNYTRIMYIIEYLVDQFSYNEIEQIALGYVNDEKYATIMGVQTAYKNMKKRGNLDEFIISLASGQSFSPVVDDDNLYNDLIRRLDKNSLKRVTKNILNSNYSEIY